MADKLNDGSGIEVAVLDSGTSVDYSMAAQVHVRLVSAESASAASRNHKISMDTLHKSIKKLEESARFNPYSSQTDVQGENESGIETYARLNDLYKSAIASTKLELHELSTLSQAINEVRKLKQYAPQPTFIEHATSCKETAVNSDKAIPSAIGDAAKADGTANVSGDDTASGGSITSTSSSKTDSSYQVTESKAGVTNDDIPGEVDTTRKRVLGKSEIINSLDAHLPTWDGKTGQSPPPLCGAIPVDQHYIVPVGHHVAAKISKPRETEIVWILATVVGFSSDKNKYIVRDIMDEADLSTETDTGTATLGITGNKNQSMNTGDASSQVLESSSKSGTNRATKTGVKIKQEKVGNGAVGSSIRETRHFLNRKYVKPLPTLAPPLYYKPSLYHKFGTEVLAMYPQTTCFYPGKVLHPPHSQANYPDREEYMIEFSDDEDMDGTIPARPVPQKHVISRPRR
eukprot:CFRG1335T1